MNVTVNGELRQLPDDASVADLVKQLGLEQHPVAAEVNRHVVPKRRHTEHQLRDGDVIEVVTLVGGG